MYAFARRSRQGSHVMIRFHTGRNQSLIYWTELTSDLVSIRSPSSTIWEIIQMLLHRLAEETMTKLLVLFFKFQNLRKKHWENTDGGKSVRVYIQLGNGIRLISCLTWFISVKQSKCTASLVVKNHQFSQKNQWTTSSEQWMWRSLWITYSNCTESHWITAVCLRRNCPWRAACFLCISCDALTADRCMWHTVQLLILKLKG